MRRAAKVDANHAEIVRALRSVGCYVVDLSRLGQGVPDLLWSRGGLCGLLEVKDGAKPPSARKLTPDEIEFRTLWRGPYAVVESVEQAIDEVNRRS